VTADSIYGGAYTLRHYLEEREQPFVLVVQSTQRVGLSAKAEHLVASWPAAVWQRLSAGESRQGPRWYDWAWMPMSWRLAPQGMAHWLLARRSVSKPDERAYYCVFGPAEVALQQVVGWYACITCAGGVPVQPLAPTGRETGIDVGLRVVLSTAEGGTVDNPRYLRTADKLLGQAHRHLTRRPRGSHRRAKAVAWLRRTDQQVQRQRRDLHHTTALDLLHTHDALSLDDVRVANLVRTLPAPRAAPMRRGGSCAPSSPAKQRTLAGECVRSPPSRPARTVAAVGSVCARA
jgi:hypothetical protein